jgi:hypothetical protein
VNPEQAKPVDPKQLFKAAEVFREARDLLYSKLRETRLRLAVPWGVNDALALELHLKCLLLIEQGTYPEEHNLKELFRNLSRQTKDVLRKEHDGIAENDPIFTNARAQIGIETNLETLLELGQDAFTQLRYAFEGTPPVGMWGLDIFTQLVRKRILLKHPDWEKW